MRIVSNKFREVCENCIWWDGDNSGMQGECGTTEAYTSVVTGRYEDCSQFLARYLYLPIGENNE